MAIRIPKPQPVFAPPGPPIPIPTPTMPEEFGTPPPRPLPLLPVPFGLTQRPPTGVDAFNFPIGGETDTEFERRQKRFTGFEAEAQAAIDADQARVDDFLKTHARETQKLARATPLQTKIDNLVSANTAAQLDLQERLALLKDKTDRDIQAGRFADAARGRNLSREIANQATMLAFHGQVLDILGLFARHPMLFQTSVNQLPALFSALGTPQQIGLEAIDASGGGIAGAALPPTRAGVAPPPIATPLPVAAPLPVATPPIDFFNGPGGPGEIGGPLIGGFPPLPITVGAGGQENPDIGDVEVSHHSHNSHTSRVAEPFVGGSGLTARPGVADPFISGSGVAPRPGITDDLIFRDGGVTPLPGIIRDPFVRGDGGVTPLPGITQSQRMSTRAVGPSALAPLPGSGELAPIGSLAHTPGALPRVASPEQIAEMARRDLRFREEGRAAPGSAFTARGELVDIATGQPWTGAPPPAGFGDLGFGPGQLLDTPNMRALTAQGAALDAAEAQRVADFAAWERSPAGRLATTNARFGAAGLPLLPALGGATSMGGGQLAPAPIPSVGSPQPSVAPPTLGSFMSPTGGIDFVALQAWLASLAPIAAFLPAAPRRVVSGVR